MPTDKWGIPFLYPSASTQGVTNNSPAYFFQQSNNITNNIDGVIHFGKEEEDVRVISTTTGEFEFPFDPSGDGLSLSGPTGHHSGGETHGCEGFAYMIDGNFSVIPPSFRFRKETYHSTYTVDPQTRTWTNGAVATNVSGWKGFCWVCYVKQDGISTGKDSRICEGWWNDNPTADITNWKLLKRTEDKGQGISNWGINSSTCDGVPYQVGTWSNIQFRIKSGSADFSLHPYVPEKANGSYIHSIGGADMSFTDSADRGYGYQARMPNNIEMKFLFRWDGGGAGKCRIKNLSLREIDPTKSFDDDPGIPPAPSPEGTTEIIGLITLKRDINSLRTSPCSPAGSGGGGGSGNAIYYSQPADVQKVLSNNIEWDYTTRIAERCFSSSSSLYGKKPVQVDLWLKKSGNPSANPTVKMKIWKSDASDTVIYTSPTEINPETTLTTSFAKYSFDFSTNTHTMTTGDRIGVEYTGTGAADHVLAAYIDSNPLTQTGYHQYRATPGKWYYYDRELAMDIWD